MAFDLTLGEVGPIFSGNLNVSNNMTARQMINMFYDRTGFQIRCSTRLHNTIDLAPNDRIDRAFISDSRRWIIVSVITTTTTVDDEGVETTTEKIRLEIQDNAAVAPTLLAASNNELGNLIAFATSFIEMNTNLLNQTLNPVKGDSAIVVFGSDKLYYIDDDRTSKELKIKTKAGTKTFANPVCGILFQGRFYAVGEGVDLYTGKTNEKHPQDIYASCIFGSTEEYTLDDFTIIETIGQEQLGAFAMRILTEIDETMYSMQDFLSSLVVLSSRGVRACNSGSQESKSLSSVLFNQNKTSVVPARKGIPSLQDSIILYPSATGLRQQQIQSILSDGGTIFDRQCVTYTGYNPKTLRFDPAKNITLGFDGLGDVKGFYWAKQPGSALSSTTYYSSNYRKCVEIARTSSSVYDFLVLLSEDGTKAYIAQETDEVSCRDLIREWQPRADVTFSVRGTKHIVHVTEFFGITSTDEMNGFWLELEPNVWCLAYHSTEDEYIIVDTVIPQEDGVFNIVPNTKNLSKQIPAEMMAEDHETEGVRLDLFVNGNHSVLNSNAPLSLDYSTVRSEVKMELSFWFENPSIEFYTGPCYYGAPQIPNHFCLLVSKELGDNFEILSNYSQSPLNTSPVQGQDYYSYKFTTTPNVGDNTSQISFVNKKITNKDAKILQLLQTP